MTDQQIKVVETMQKYGGGFIKALAECFLRADDTNFKKLQNTFLDYWITYEERAEQETKNYSPYNTQDY